MIAQFTAKVGTVFNDSPPPLSKCLPALWLVTNAKNGISSCELARSLKITQKSAWFLGHRLRTAIQRGGGIVRADGVFRTRGEEAAAKKKRPGQKARRWVVERTHSWFNRFRSILTRWSKKAANYQAMLYFVCGLIAYRAALFFG